MPPSTPGRSPASSPSIPGPNDCGAISRSGGIASGASIGALSGEVLAGFPGGGAAMRTGGGAGRSTAVTAYRSGRAGSGNSPGATSGPMTTAAITATWVAVVALALRRLAENIPSPNGITLSTNEKHVYVGVTRSNSVWRLPLMADGSVSKTGVAIQLSGGVAGPDGIEMDSENGLLVCQLGVGIWRFDANMLPTHLVYAEGHHHHHLDNLAFGGPDNKTIYITEALSGDVLMARMPVAGKKMYGLS